ncbi:MAG: ABC transporter permease [Candidatus Tectomicrobia bacterium]|nr:ABC transporter permease [Candidatus Tectomicrobia bacterium]
MHKYIIRKILHTIPIILGITSITFILMNVVPGDPVAYLVDERLQEIDPLVAANVRKQWGLDKPLYLQYFYYIANVTRGNLGISFRYNQDVLKIILERLPASTQLALASMFVAVLIGTVSGIIAAIKQNSSIDTGSMVVALAGVSMPSFWQGLMMMWVFGVLWPILPPSGYGGGSFKYLIMPSITLGTGIAALIARMTRSSMLNVVRQEYVTTARAKGLSEKVVIFKHALKNALIPVVTVIGVQMGGVLTGAVITETVFNWPGVGRLLVDSLNQRDTPLVQGCVIFIAVIFVAINTIVDIIYVYLDPRIRYGE